MKSLLRRTSPALVLALGLISCNKQNESSLRLPEPTWETNQGVEKFSTVNQPTAEHKMPTRLLSDRLSFENTPSVQLRVTTRCRQENPSNKNDQSYYQQQVMFTLPSKIAIFSMMPPDGLKPAALAKPLFCSFTFVAMNSEGATHSFHTNEVSVKDSSAHEGIEPVSNVAKYEEKDFDKSEFRLRTSQTLDTRLICDYADMSAHHVDNRPLKLSEFTLPKDAKFRRHPSENCRILGIEKGVATMMSAPFSVEFRADGPAFETHARSQIGKAFNAQMDAFVFRIYNPTSQTLRFQIPRDVKDFFAAAANMYGKSDNYCHVLGLNYTDLEFATVKFDSTKSPGVLVSEQTPTEIVLPSESSITGQIEVRVRPVNSQSYRLGDPLISADIGYIVQQAKSILVNVFTDETAKESYPVSWNIQEVQKVGIYPRETPALPCTN